LNLITCKITYASDANTNNNNENSNEFRICRIPRLNGNVRNIPKTVWGSLLVKIEGYMDDYMGEFSGDIVKAKVKAGLTCADFQYCVEIKEMIKEWFCKPYVVNSIGT